VDSEVVVSAVYDQSHLNLITLNLTGVDARTALIWVHELTHAREHLRGRPYQAQRCTREQFAEMIVQEGRVKNGIFPIRSGR
jgi:hypothetical protein